MEKSIPCDGCGAKISAQRRIGCFHDFGTEDSAWVRKYHKQGAAPLANLSTFTVDNMLANMAGACQDKAILDHPVVRGVIIRSFAQWVQLRPGRDHQRDWALIKELQAHPDWDS
jgi:hypothetical protein